LNTVQILVYLYSLAGLGLQYLNLYRSVWWLPHRYRTGTATSHLTWYSEVSGTPGTLRSSSEILYRIRNIPISWIRIQNQWIDFCLLTMKNQP